MTRYNKLKQTSKILSKKKKTTKEENKNTHAR